MTDMFGLEGQGALVIGGGQGIGESTALTLARCGCDVAIVDVSQERAESVSQKVMELGGRSAAFTADVMEITDYSALISQAHEALPQLSRLVTVVGAAGWGPLLETSLEVWEREQRLNLNYVFLAGKAFAASLIQRRRPGSLVFVSSVSGMQAAPNHAAYGAAKAGMISLVKTMAVEWGTRGIRVNAVAPGTVVTPRRTETPERAEQVLKSHIPMKRRGATQDIANGAVFLSSEMASYVTGHTLPVDGGWMAANILLDA
jgi:3-oxoacyl-[acyl-carrier protein] reductase